jgi:hypothetical protein
LHFWREDWVLDGENIKNREKVENRCAWRLHIQKEFAIFALTK